MFGALKEDLGFFSFLSYPSMFKEQYLISIWKCIFTIRLISSQQKQGLVHVWLTSRQVSHYSDSGVKNDLRNMLN